MSKILTSPSSFGQVGPEPVDLLVKSGYEVINNPYGRKLTEDEVIELAKDCIGIVAGVEPLTPRVMDSLPLLKCISRVGIGMDSVDLKYAAQKGIVVTNTPNGPTRSVAELTLAMTFALLRKIPQADADLKNRVWKKQTGNLIFNKVIGVVGLGRIGRLVSELFRGIGNPVIGYDPYSDPVWAEKTGVKLVDFETILKSADIITLHVPGNEDKSPVIGTKELELVKSSAMLINISRGGIVDEDALYNALTTKKLTSAAIDVFTEEPYAGPLCDLENVVLTPHLGSYAEEGKLLMEIDAVNNLIEALS
ncbi:phosphoglycerate dehydrogenase [Mucilaginibacter sp. OK283]|jgi:D-3-phosphoglycerate dehydrogenase|uniref:phosphoglycerate dehydrogenase n=1 Tax=Mucilaginibacter sp. OK283 TaxID=1881049 RepID=UPI0008C6D864|nr:phosphoglycerate dehydrogenase [Mucilaginibacter sp. OK283]SEO46085.1 D-3-phosphoglycerate dehydrogenase [Mucilaginibacter sp. OK283]